MQRPRAPRPIQSRHHPIVKQVRALVRSGELLSEGELLLETPRLIADAIDSSVAITKLLISDSPSAAAKRLMRAASPETLVYEAPADLLASLSTTETSQGVLAFAEAPEWSEPDLFRAPNPLILVLDGVQDPGNLGTILRSADAFGAAGLMLTKGTVSPYNAKAIRAAAGSLFRLPVLRGFTPRQVEQMIGKHQIPLLATLPSGGRASCEVDFRRGAAVALGSEGSGLSTEYKFSNDSVTVPIGPQVESLNVATTASVILYEASRQRGLSSFPHSENSAARTTARETAGAKP